MSINYMIDSVTKSSKYTVSGSRFGLRPAHSGLIVDYKGQNYHIGVDYGTPTGTPLYSPDEGELVMVDASGKGAYGKYVMVYLPHQKISVHMAHMDTVDVKNGQKVKRGQRLGTTGNTGLSTGPHLHLGIAKGKKQDLKKGAYMDGTWLNPSEYDFKVKPEPKPEGKEVIVNGRLHSNSAGSGPGKTLKNHKGRITREAKGAKFPYHIDRLGWVSAEAIGENVDKPNPSTPKTLKVGDSVTLNGTVYTTAAGAKAGKTFKNHKGKITHVSAGSKFPYHVDSLGWVSEGSVGAKAPSKPAPSKPKRNRHNQNVKVGDKIQFSILYSQDVGGVLYRPSSLYYTEKRGNTQVGYGYVNRITNNGYRVSGTKGGTTIGFVRPVNTY